MNAATCPAQVATSDPYVKLGEAVLEADPSVLLEIALRTGNEETRKMVTWYSLLWGDAPRGDARERFILEWLAGMGCDMSIPADGPFGLQWAIGYTIMRQSKTRLAECMMHTTPEDSTTYAVACSYRLYWIYKPCGKVTTEQVASLWAMDLRRSPKEAL